MKQTSILHLCCMLLVLIGNSFLASYCYMNKQYLAMTLFCFVIVWSFFRIVNTQQKNKRMVLQMLKDFQVHDFSLHYSYQGKSYIDRQITELINETVQKLKETYLHYEEESSYYKTLLNTIDSCLLVCNQDGKVIWSNHYADTQLCGHAFHHLKELEILNPQFPDMLFHIKPGEVKSIRIYRDEIAIDWAITETRYIQKGICYRLFHLRNIRTLLEENEMEAWQKLVRVLTHEIMNSIAPVISLSETLIDYLPLSETTVSQSLDEGEQQQNYDIIRQGLETIHRRSKGLLGFVDNYRKLTKIGTPILSPVKVSVIMNNLKLLFPKLPITFHTQHTDCTLLIDNMQVEQVFINLLKNAYESCEDNPNPQIIISSRYDADRQIYVISITDNGKGILPEVQDKIFVPFFTTKKNGSGIGLSICKQIMTLHNGSISVTSVPHKSTTFTIKFVNLKESRKSIL